MGIVVQKFGGTSLADTDKIKNVAKAVIKEKNNGNDVVVIVSAMGHTTDYLVKLSSEISKNPNKREMDMLLSTGEQVSIALLTMAIQEEGYEAISLNASQVGIITENVHSTARIIDIKTDKLNKILDEGKITDAQGRTVNFENTIIIMTSNAGSNLNNNSIGFGKTTVDNNKILDSLKQTFRPEFLNRVDEIITFDSLTKNDLLQIIDLLLKDTEKALKEKNLNLKVTDKAKEFILEKGTDLKYGARPLRRTIQKYIEDEIAEKLLRGEFIENNHTICVDYKDDNITIN